jgi:hypothetical protein
MDMTIKRIIRPNPIPANHPIDLNSWPQGTGCPFTVQEEVEVAMVVVVSDG